MSDLKSTLLILLCNEWRQTAEQAFEELMRAIAFGAYATRENRRLVRERDEAVAQRDKMLEWLKPLSKM